MLWLLLALIAHFGNALVFVVDKSLLSRGGNVADPLHYAFYSAVLAGAAVIILPWAYAPLTSFVFTWSVITGALHIIALWFFFIALKQGEPSRIVPITGSAVPIFTLVMAITWLGEKLTIQQLIGIGLLIIGGVLLSISLGQVKKIPPSILGVSLLAGLFFAAYFAGVKYMYDNTQPFLAAFVYGRVIEAAVALVVLGPIVFWRQQPARRSRVKSKKKSAAIPLVFMGNKVLAAGAFLLQNYALSLGSVTVVNALQGTQYVFVLILAALISSRLPSLFKEEVHRVALLQKLAGIIVVSLGMFFLI